MLAPSRALFTLATISIATLIGTACSSDDDAPKTYSRKGRVTAVDHTTRQVSMVTKDKRGEETTINGTYTDETVVIINGRNMTIKDIREGDTVEVVGRKEGEDTNQRLVATEVRITRFEGDWQDTGKSDREGEATTETVKTDTTD